MAYDERLADRVRDILMNEPGLSERKMFGGIAFMIRGNMSCGVLRDVLLLRLGNEGTASALRLPHTRPMDFTGKPMRSMLYVDPEGTDSDRQLRMWIETAITFARTLPPK